jgi:hypothetical protein
LQGDPGPKGEPGEKSHWVSSGPALASPAQETIHWPSGGGGAPTSAPLQPGLLGRSLPQFSVTALSHPVTHPGQGQPYQQTPPSPVSIFVPDSTSPLWPFQARVALPIPAGGQGEGGWVTQITLHFSLPAAIVLSQQELWPLLPVCRRKGGRKTASLKGGALRKP